MATHSSILASLIALLVNNPPAVQETPVQFLCWEDPLEEGIGYPLQYSWVSLVAQLVKNLPAMREIRVRSPDWKDPLEKGKATQSSILAWYSPWCHKESDATFTLTFFGSLLLGGLFL